MDFATISSSTGTAISGVVGNIYDLVGDNLGVILTLLSITIGLPFIVRMFKRFSK